MKKTLLGIVLVLAVSSLSFAITLVQKSDENPEFTLSGHVWLRHTLQYNDVVPKTNALSINRNYITMKLTGTDYISNVILDIVNKSGAQADGDFSVWLKNVYVELTKVPFLADAGINVRAGIQSMYTGTNTLWKYNLYEVPIESVVGLSSADMGVALIGKALDKMITYELAAYSGDGYKKVESDMLKALCADVKVNVLEGLNIIGTYYRKTGVTGFNTESSNLDFTEAVVTYSTGPLVESYAAAIETKAAANPAVGKSGIGQYLSFYAGVKALDWLSVFARMDIINPDTGKDNDETNAYYGGVVIPVASKANLLIDYTLKQKRIQLSDDKNDNIFTTQVKWDW